MSFASGDQLGPWTIESVSAEAMRQLAVILDDPNPIHVDPAAAKAAGLGDRVVNQGPANFGYVLNMLQTAVPSGSVHDLRLRLMANVFAGDRVVAAGRVEAVDEHGGARRLTCAVWLDVDGAGRALEGTATVTIAS